MRSWTPQQIADAAGARLVATGANGTGPERAVIDSREAGPGALFVGLKGAHTDGGAFARHALEAGAWGALVGPKHAQAASRTPGALLAADDPLHALQRLATAWRRALKAQVIGVTGSTGKTSTKDLLAALLTPHRRTVASRANFNTEIGLPLEILSAPAGTEVLVLEMAMRGQGQIAELAQIAEPDVGVIVSVGPVHLELLGTVEAVAAAKAELIAALPRGGTAIVPAHEPLLEPHIRPDLKTIKFGDGGDVRLGEADGERLGEADGERLGEADGERLGEADGERVGEADGERLTIDLAGETISVEVSFDQAHLRRNLLAAIAAADAIGVRPTGRIELTPNAGRGQRVRLGDGIVVIDDCYNANPMSMRAALEDLAAVAGRGGHQRRVAVLGDMLELGTAERDFHLEIGERARATGVDLLVTVGPRATSMTERFDGAAHSVHDATEAASLLPSLVRPGDAILVKGSRGVGLELVCRALSAAGTRG